MTGCDHIERILLGQHIVALGAAQQIHLAQQMTGGPGGELALLHGVGILGQVGLGKLQVLNDVSEHLLLRGPREGEDERGLDGLHPGHIAIEIDQRPIGVGAEEAGFGLIELLVGGIVPVVVLFGVDQQLVGRGDQVVGPVPVGAHEEGRGVERQFGKGDQRTVAHGTHAADVGRDLQHLVGAGAVVHEGTALTPGVVLRTCNGIESGRAHLETQRAGVGVVGSQRALQILFEEIGTARSDRQKRTGGADLDIIRHFHGKVSVKRLRLIPGRRSGRSGTMQTRYCRS